MVIFVRESFFNGLFNEKNLRVRIILPMPGRCLSGNYIEESTRENAANGLNRQIRGRMKN